MPRPEFCGTSNRGQGDCTDYSRDQHSGNGKFPSGLLVRLPFGPEDGLFERVHHRDDSDLRRRYWRLVRLAILLIFLDGFELLRLARLQPLVQLGRKGVYSGAAGARYAMKGKPAHGFPALDGSLSAAKIGRDFFPRVQTSSKAGILSFRAVCERRWHGLALRTAGVA